MANLRRHFNFSAKSSLQEPELSFHVSKAEKNNCFDKTSLSKDISFCLELCCTYIQTLNALCSAGSSLAKSLFLAVQDVPAYHSISQQFVTIWEEVSKATAGASASVKTETLMMLQEVINTLEMGNNNVDMDDTITESFQVIGTCLCSFIELQSQFSWSTWKSLSKLSKNFSNDSFRRTLQWKSNEKFPVKISMNSDLNSTIKKHFSQIFCKSKVNESSGNSQSNIYASNVLRRDAAYSHLSTPEVSTNNSPDSSLWSPSSTIWSSTANPKLNTPALQQGSSEDSNMASVTHSELDEVINLLSCAPVQLLNDNTIDNQNQNFPHSSNNEQVLQSWTNDSVSSIPRQYSSRESWSKDSRDITFGYDSWIWRADNMNCSGFSMGDSKHAEQKSEIHIAWENTDLQKWSLGMCETGSSSDDASSVHGLDGELVPSEMNNFSHQVLYSVRHRRHNSGESLPGGLENLSIKDMNVWDLHSSKMSTWPLKQSAHRTSSEGELYEAQFQTKYPPFHFVFS